jgi:hypothetical protein
LAELALLEPQVGMGRAGPTPALPSLPESGLAALGGQGLALACYLDRDPPGAGHLRDARDDDLQDPVLVPGLDVLLPTPSGRATLREKEPTADSNRCIPPPSVRSS